MEKILHFLSELELNNNREWFTSKKTDYQVLKKEFEQFTGKLILAIGQFDPGILGVTASGSIFRIHRDTRFSNDKTPYKNNFGAHLSTGGKNSGNPGYYFHVQPGESFISAGIYMPSSDKLKAIRKEIYNFPEDFRQLIEDPFYRKNLSLFEEDKLKRPPTGFPADFELIEYLKYKHLAPWMPVSDKQLTSPDLFDKMVDTYRRMKVFNDFIYRALEDLNS